MGSLPPRARFFAACATGLLVVALPAVSGATTSDKTVYRTVHGTPGADTIIGKRHSERVKALAGNDYVRLGGGSDVAFGQDGDDWLHGNDGKDVVSGGAGNDHPQGGGGNDRVYGGSGVDELDGDAGHDLIFAGSGDDGVTGDEGNDTIYPGTGADIIYGEQGFNHIIAKDDGVADRFYCSMINRGQAPGLLTYIGKKDPLDVIVLCKVKIK